MSEITSKNNSSKMGPTIDIISDAPDYCDPQTEQEPKIEDTNSTPIPPFDPESAKKEKLKKELQDKVMSWNPNSKGEEFNFKDYLGLIPDMKNIDYASSIREGLKERLRRGYSKVDGNKVSIWVSSIFDTKGFKTHQGEIGLDFKDPDIFDLSLNGFMEIMQFPSVKSSGQLNWYYNNIFKHNPNKFLSFISEYKKSEECNDTTKARIDEFLQNNEDIQEYIKESENQ